MIGTTLSHYRITAAIGAARTPRTEYRLSAAGRRAFEKYLDHMDALIKASRKKQGHAVGLLYAPPMR